MATVIDPNISYILSNNLLPYRDLFLKHCPAPLRISKDTVISQSGLPASPMYFLLEGMVKIYTTNPGGYVRILGYHKHNTLCAMDKIVGPGEPAVVTVESVTELKALQVTKESLLAIDKEAPGFLYSLLQYYGTVLRLVCFDAELKSVTSATARLAAFLCLYETNRSKSGPLPLTQDELASAINASRVQVARICSAFKKRGLIACSRGSVTVLNPDELGRLSQYY